MEERIEKQIKWYKDYQMTDNSGIIMGAFDRGYIAGMSHCLDIIREENRNNNLDTDYE